MTSRLRRRTWLPFSPAVHRSTQDTVFRWKKFWPISASRWKTSGTWIKTARAMAKAVIWSTEARADVRAIDRDTALGLLKALARFLKTEAGDVKQLHGFDPPQYRLRIGDWRVIFRKSGADSIEVVRVRNRREAYR